MPGKLRDGTGELCDGIRSAGELGQGWVRETII